MKIASLEIDLLANIARLQQDMRRAEGTVERSMRQIERQVQRVQRAFAALGLGVGFGAMARQAQQLSDAWQGMENRLRLVTQTNRQLARSMDDVYRIARGTSQQMDSVGQVYQRFAENAGQLGLNLSDVADLTNTVAKAVAISGASAQAAEAAIIQFGQAMASAELRGEELRSVMEQTPGLARAIADGLGVPIGALRDLAEQGKLTANEVIRALRNAADSVDAKFATRVKTVGQAWTDLNTELTKYVGQMSQATGATQSVVSVIETLASNLDGIGRSLIFLAATAVPAAVRALRSLTAAMLAVPGMQLVKVLGVAAGALLAFHDKIKIPEGALKSLGTTWDLFASGFSAGSSVVLDVLGWLGDKTAAFFKLFDSGPAEAARNLRDPFQEAALSIAGVADQMYGGFTGNLAAIGAAFRVTAGNIRIAFSNSLNAVREQVSEWVHALAQSLNQLPGVNIETGLWVGPDPENYRNILEEARKAFEEGSKVLGMRDALVQRIAQGTLEGLNDAFDIPLVEGHTAAIVKNGEGAGKANSAYQSLIASIRSKIEENQLEIATGDKASEADKLRIKLTQDLAAGKLKLSAAQKQLVEQLLRGLKASEQELNISKMLQAAKKKENDLSVEAVKAAYDEARSNEHAAATFGMTASEIERLTLARLEDQLAQAASLDLTQEQITALELLIEAHRRNVGALTSIEWREQQKSAWEAWARDVEQIFDQVGQSLTDAIFDGGKSGRDLLRDLFKGLTFNILINPVMNQMQGWVTNQLGGLFGVQNPQQGGGMFGLAQNASSLHSAFTGGFTDTLASGINWLGEQFGSSALQSFAAGMTGTATVTSTTLGAATMVPGLGVGLTGGAAAGGGLVSGASGLVPGLGVGTGGGAAAAGGAMSGAAGGSASAGSLFASAAPWVMGGLAIASAFGLFDDRLPTTRRSQQGASHMLPDGSWEVSSWDDRQDTASQIAARDFAQAAVKHANDLFERIGIDAQIHSFQTLMESSILGDKQGVGSSGQVRIGDVIRDIGLTVESSWTKHGFGGWSDQPMLPRLQADIQLTILEAFQAAGDQLPSVLSGMLEGVDIRSLGAEQAQELAQSFQMVVDQVSAFQAAVELLPFANLRDLSFDAAANLISFAGGLEALNSGLSAYYENFFTAEEQLTHQVGLLSQTFGELGFTLPDVYQSGELAKMQFRAIADSLDVTTEEGARTYATLMSVAGSFAQAANAADQLAEASRRAAQEAFSLAVSEGEAAYNALARSINSQKTRLQREAEQIAEALRNSISAATDTVSALTSLTGRLTSTLQRMVSTGLDDGRNREWAQERIARALSVATLTGVMPEGADFEQALQLVAQPSQGLFDSFEDYQADFLRTAHDINALNELAGVQLTAEQRALESLERQLANSQEWYQAEMARLDGVLEYHRMQLDIAAGTYEVELSQLDAIKAVEAAVKNIRIAAAAAQKAQQQSGAQRSRELQYLADNPDVMAQYGQHGRGMSLEEYARLHYDLHGRKEGRSFAVGTPYVPYDMMANIHRGEIIIDPRSSDILRRYGIGVQGGGNDAALRLVQQELREMRQMQQTLLEEIGRNTNDTARTNRQMTQEPQPVVVTQPVLTVAAVPGQ